LVGLTICTVLEPSQTDIVSVAGIANFALVVCPIWIPPKIGIAVQISWIALSVGTTTASTLIIVACILLVSRMPGASKQPHLAAEIITESAALYSISALIYISLSVAHTSSVVDLLTTYIQSTYADAFFAYLAVSPLLI
jgi:hypothetical protein